MRILLEWITLGRYGTFAQEKKKRILEYIEKYGAGSGAHREYREKEVVLIIQRGKY